MGQETTTRRVYEEDVAYLKEMQAHLAQRGIKVSQPKLVDLIIRFAIVEETLFIRRMKEGEVDADALLEDILENPERKRKADAVREHDITV